jgi:hypothetical protein
MLVIDVNALVGLLLLLIDNLYVMAQLKLVGNTLGTVRNRVGQLVTLCFVVIVMLRNIMSESLT